jgi:hypothetical protein
LSWDQTRKLRDTITAPNSVKGLNSKYHMIWSGNMVVTTDPIWVISHLLQLCDFSISPLLLANKAFLGKVYITTFIGSFSCIFSLCHKFHVFNVVAFNMFLDSFGPHYQFFSWFLFLDTLLHTLFVFCFLFFGSISLSL